MKPSLPPELWQELWCLARGQKDVRKRLKYAVPYFDGVDVRLVTVAHNPKTTPRPRLTGERKLQNGDSRWRVLIPFEETNSHNGSIQLVSRFLI